MSSTKIHWARILLGGRLAEVALILAIVPLGLRLGDDFLHYTAPPGSFIMCFFKTRIAARTAMGGSLAPGTAIITGNTSTTTPKL